MARFPRKVLNLLTNSNIQQAYSVWCMARLRGRPPQINLPGGGRITATKKFNDFYGIWVQHPDEAEFRTYQELLKDGDIFVDVGANMGLTSTLAASAARLGRIVAFEPTHAYAACWHENIALNGITNACLLQCAATNQPGSFEFIVNPNAPMHNRLNLGDALNRYAQPTGDSTRTEKVPAVTLDGVSNLLALDSVGVLKIDVEGAEYLVLQGAVGLLKRRAIRAMILEFIPEFMDEMGINPCELVEFLDGFGYQFFRIRKEGGVGEPLPSAAVVNREFEGLNVLALRRDDR